MSTKKRERLVTHHSPLKDSFFIPDLCKAQTILIAVLLSELMLLVHVLSSGALQSFNWHQFAAKSLFVQWVLLLSFQLVCLSRQKLSRLSVGGATATTLGLVCVITAGSSLLAQQLLVPPLDIPGDTAWVLRNVVVALVLSGIILRYFFLQHQIYMKERLELQARLDYLVTRIKPHFLFNTLNSIASLIGTRPDTAEQCVEDLAELFRESLKDNQALSSVEDEIKRASIYLNIERLRLGERLSVMWDVDDGLRDVAVPSLILQPLVENAVYHGIAPLPEGGELRISIQGRAGKLQIELTNPVTASLTPSKGNAIALENIRQRLLVLYGSEASLSLQRSEAVFSVQLALPIAGKIVN